MKFINKMQWLNGSVWHKGWGSFEQRGDQLVWWAFAPNYQEIKQSIHQNWSRPITAYKFKLGWD